MKTSIIVVDTNRLDKKIAALNNKLAKRGDTGRIVVLSVTPVEKIVEVSDEDCAPRNVEVPALEVELDIPEGDFGETYIMKFTDSRGSELTWFASNPPDLTVGDKVTIVGRVKSHGEYMGVRNTVLTRCKIDVLK
jgi:hypothetical protein